MTIPFCISNVLQQSRSRFARLEHGFEPDRVNKGRHPGIGSLALRDKLFLVDKNETYYVSNGVSPAAFIAVTSLVCGEIRHARKPFILGV